MSAEFLDSILNTAVANSIVAAGIAACALVVARLRFSPTLAHCLWVLVLLKLVTPPMFTVEVAMPIATRAETPNLNISPPREPVALSAPATQSLLGPVGLAGPPPAAIAPRPVTEPIDWLAIGLSIWALGVLLALGVAASRAIRFQRRLNHSRSTDRRTAAEVRRLAETLGLRRAPSVSVLPGCFSPMLWSFFGRARILIPQDLASELSTEQLRALLAHELAHYHRRDHWVRHLELVVRAVYWFNPLVGWACRQMRASEEECCDAWVVWALPDDSRSYADALLDTVEFLSETNPSMPSPASGIGTVTNLKRRLTMIMKGDNRRTLTNLGRAFVLGLAALTLPLVPALAQEREHEHEERRAHKSISVKKLKEMVHRHELETRKVKQQLAELKSRLHRDGEDVDHEKLHAAHNKLHKHLKVLHERHANLLKEVDGQRIVIEDTERRVRRARKDVDRRDRELRHLHEKHNEKKGDAHDPDHIKSVIQALNQAIHLLHDKGHKRDAEALLQLSAKIHETHNPKHKAKSKTKPRAKYDDYQGRDRKFYEVDRAFAPEQAKAKYSVYAKAYERAKEQKRYDEAKKLHAKMEQIQVEYHAKAKVQEPRPSTGHDARMRKLEERVLHLTRAVEKLIHEKKRSNGRRRDREDVEVEEIEESVIEEEEIEAVEEVEEEINEVRIKLRKSKGANRGRRTVR